MDVSELDPAAAPARILPALAIDVDVGPSVDCGEYDGGRSPRHGEDLDVRGGLAGSGRADEHRKEYLQKIRLGLDLLSVRFGFSSV